MQKLTCALEGGGVMPGSLFPASSWLEMYCSKSSSVTCIRRRQLVGLYVPARVS